MIHYSLKCDNDHQFDSWFDGVDAFEKLEKANLLSCSVCGSSHVTRAIMAPQVAPSRSKESTPLSAPLSKEEQAIAAVRQKVEAESEDVGDNFASEARAIHEGDKPARSIYGQAKIDDAKALIEDGVPVVPLPWTKRRAN